MSIPRELIDPEADKVVRRLKRHGHMAFLVGGCVRDLLLGRTPKDFDVATSATPPEIKDLFRNCRIIGRRFRLAHIFFGQKIIETSTFRMNPREGVEPDEVEELLIRRDNVFGTAEEDARRRDFTINGLFYDVEAGEVIDYVGGRADLEARLVRTIGDPDIRFREDPVRILRAIKFAARLGFQVEPTTYTAMLSHRGEIPKCAAPRVLEEVYRLLRGAAAHRSMELLLETGVAATLAPELAWFFGGGDPPAGAPAIDVAALHGRAWRILEELDTLVREGRNDEILGGAASNALLLCTLAAAFIETDDSPDDQETDAAEAQGLEPHAEARGEAGESLQPAPVVDQGLVIERVLVPLVARLRVSRRDAERARQILLAQRRLAPGRRRRSRPMAMVKRDYFGEALTVYELVARASGDVGDEIGRWKQMWRSAQREHARREPGPDRMGAEGGAGAGPGPGFELERQGDGAPLGERRRRRRRGGRRRRRGGQGLTTAVSIDGLTGTSPGGTLTAVAEAPAEAPAKATASPVEDPE